MMSSWLSAWHQAKTNKKMFPCSIDPKSEYTISSQYIKKIECIVYKQLRTFWKNIRFWKPIFWYARSSWSVFSLQQSSVINPILVSLKKMSSMYPLLQQKVSIPGSNRFSHALSASRWRWPMTICWKLFWLKKTENKATRQQGLHCQNADLSWRLQKEI